MTKINILKLNKSIYLITIMALSFKCVLAQNMELSLKASNTENLAKQELLTINNQISLGESAQQTAYIKASNTDVGDWFGSIAIDGNTLVVGAPGEDSIASGVNGDEDDNSSPLIPDQVYSDILVGSGAAYVFVKNNGVWEQEAYLKASNPDAGDYFGLSVAISGDTIVVSAMQEDGVSSGINGDESNGDVSVNSGAVYVFVRSNGEWEQQAYIKASNADMFDYFGTSIDLHNDTLVVGAIGEASNATGVNGNQDYDFQYVSGAAYVFIRSNDIWSQEAYIKASNTDSFDGFGSAVSLFDDTLAIASYNEDSNAIGINGDQNNNLAQESGAVYVFTRLKGSWSQQAYIKPSNTGVDDKFGSLDLSADTLVVSSSLEDSNSLGVNGDQQNNLAENSGAVYVFTRDLSNWSQQAYIKPLLSLENERFGSGVNILGDLLAISNNTGYFVNETNEYEDGEPSSVYLFERYSGEWSQQNILQAPNAEFGDSFYGVLSGSSLIASNISEDSNSTGVNGDSSNNLALESGAVFVISPIQVNIVFRSGFE